MRYIDTSVLVAYLTRESGSTAAENLMRSAGSPIAVSSWTEVELLSALGIKIRTKQLSPVMADSIVKMYKNTVFPLLQYVPVTDADHREACVLLTGWRSALRAGDSLHLAIAKMRGAEIYTFDRLMATIGSTIGLNVTLI